MYPLGVQECHRMYVLFMHVTMFAFTQWPYSEFVCLFVFAQWPYSEFVCLCLHSGLILRLFVCLCLHSGPILKLFVCLFVFAQWPYFEFVCLCLHSGPILSLFVCLCLHSGPILSLFVCLFAFAQWPYSEFVDIAPSPKADNELVITVKKGKKQNTMTFICDQRSDLLTECLQFSAKFCGNRVKKYEKVRTYVCVGGPLLYVLAFQYSTILYYGTSQYYNVAQYCTYTANFLSQETWESPPKGGEISMLKFSRMRWYVRSYSSQYRAASIFLPLL